MKHSASDNPTIWVGNVPLILASKSPSRLALLNAAGLSADVVFPQVDERAVEERYIAEGGSIITLAMCLAQAKTVNVSSLHKQAYCLGADQTVTVGERLLHKSSDIVEAASSLALLSGRTHRLTSAFCVARNGKTLFSESDTADLHMRTLDTSEIARYLELVGPAVLSSVGCYQVEGHGVQLFDWIHGNHATIIGLPIFKLLSCLRRQKLVL
jgi:nucleoside triphosphate pyrophosphatase